MERSRKLKNGLRVVISEKYHHESIVRFLCRFSSRRKSLKWVIENTSELGDLVRWLFINARFKNKTNSMVFMLVKHCTLSLCVNNNGAKVDANLFRILGITFQFFPRVFVDFIPLLNNLRDDCLFEISIRAERKYRYSNLRTFSNRLKFFISKIEIFRKKEREEYQLNDLDNLDGVDLSALTEDVIFYVVFSFFDEVDLIRLSGNVNSEYRRKLLESLSGRKSKSERFFFFLFHPPHLVNDASLSVLIENDIVDTASVMEYTFPLLFKNYPKSLSCVLKKKDISNFAIRRSEKKKFHFKNLSENPQLLYDFICIYIEILSRLNLEFFSNELIFQFFTLLNFLKLMNSDFKINEKCLYKIISIVSFGGKRKLELHNSVCDVYHSCYHKEEYRGSLEKSYLLFFFQHIQQYNIHQSESSFFVNIEYILKHTREEYRQKEFQESFVEVILTSEKQVPPRIFRYFFEEIGINPSFENRKFLRLAKLSKKWNWLILYLITFDSSDNGFKDLLTNEEIIVIINEFNYDTSRYFWYEELEIFRLSIIHKIPMLLEKCEFGEQEINNLFCSLLNFGNRRYGSVHHTVVLAVQYNGEIIKEMLQYLYTRNYLKKEYLTISGIVEKVFELKNGENEKSLRLRAASICIGIGKCTAWATGKRLVNQKSFFCGDCKSPESLRLGLVCQVCAKKCHGHNNNFVEGVVLGECESYCGCYFGEWAIECKCKNGDL